MQPYLFPYLGYFQLINAVDTFIYYDDVNYIKSGYINRNYLLSNQSKSLFTVPLKDASSNKLINQTEISDNKPWQKKIEKQVFYTYKKAPHFDVIYPLIREAIFLSTNSISELAIHSIETVLTYLNIDTLRMKSSDLEYDQSVNKLEKVLSICSQFNTTTYINPVGGKDLYDSKDFDQHGMELFFISMNEIIYKQFDTEQIVSNLSIIDLLMFVDKEELRLLLNEYSLQ